MKRVRNLLIGDLYVGRQNWSTFTGRPEEIRPVRRVSQSWKKPHKWSLVYELHGRGHQFGKVRRDPDFYVIVVKTECVCPT